MRAFCDRFHNESPLLWAALMMFPVSAPAGSTDLTRVAPENTTLYIGWSGRDHVIEAAEGTADGPALLKDLDGILVNIGMMPPDRMPPDPREMRPLLLSRMWPTMYVRSEKARLVVVPHPWRTRATPGRKVSLSRGTCRVSQ